MKKAELWFSEMREMGLMESIEEELQFHTTTDTPTFDNMLKNPEYFEEAKGITFDVVDMAPNDYLDIGIDGMWNRSYSMRRDYGNDKQHFKKILLQGRVDTIKHDGKEFWSKVTHMYMPWLEFRKDNGFSQEGFHRAIKARKEGNKTMPVLVVYNNVPKKDILRKFPTLKSYVRESSIIKEGAEEATAFANQVIKALREDDEEALERALGFEPGEEEAVTRKADNLVKDLTVMITKYKPFTENVSVLKESNAFQVVSHNSYGELVVLSSKGVRYRFSEINPFVYKKIETYIRHKNYGPAWQMLNRFPSEKIENENSEIR